MSRIGWPRQNKRVRGPVCGFAANQATMCLAAYFGIIAFAPVRHVVADPAVRV